jgi:hypothetical protein
MEMALAALITWVLTAGLGFFMLGTWVSNGGTRTDGSGTSHFRPPVVFGHFLLAAAGLVVWVVYLVTDSQALAWAAFVDLLVVAGIGDTLVYRWFKDRKTGGGRPADSSGSRHEAGGSAARAGGAVGTHPPLLAEQRIPQAAVAAHGVFAVATVVLVLLTALGVGGS